MPVTSGNAAPYAPSSAILDILHRHRTRGLPTPINFEVLGRAGITDSLVPRTIQALKTLDLIDSDGKPTPTFEGLRMAPEAEYKQSIAEWLNKAYADVLNFVDPANVDEMTLRDAFRSYTPIGQQSRMVTLFAGLYAAAGIGPERTKTSTSKKRPIGNGASTPKQTKPATVAEPPPPPPPGQKQEPPEEGIKTLKWQLVHKFPAFDPGWPQATQDAWFQGFQKLLAAVEDGRPASSGD